MFFQLKINRQHLLSALTAVVVASVLAACGNGGSSSSSNNNIQPIYTMVFDAGSSGTRVNFYKVVPGNGGYPQITLLDNQKFKDNGINDFLSGNGTIKTSAWTATSSTGLPSNYTAPGCNMTSSTQNGGPADVSPCVIQPLLDSMAGAMAAVGVTASQVKVELFATAGMRTMALFNGGSYTDAAIASFYETMKNYTQTTKGYVVGEFRTSNGNSEEGLWTWINLNDQYYNAFGGNTTYYTGTPTTRGDFEVGGSSMQVAFPTISTPGASNNVYGVTINGRSYNVFSKTYLGLGGDDARKFMRSYNYDNTTNSSLTYTGLDCFGSYANSTNTTEDSGVSLFYASFFPAVTVPGGGNPTGVTWATVLSNTGSGTPLVMSAVGAYNLNSCSIKYNAVTNAVFGLSRNNYGTLNEGGAASYSDLVAQVKSSSAKFVGLDGFFYAAKELGLASASTIYNTGVTESAVAATLGINGTVCKDGDTGPAPVVGETGVVKSGMSTCANATYMQNFLWQANGLFTSPNSPLFDGVVPSDYQGKAVLTWTRGYLLKKYAN